MCRMLLVFERCERVKMVIKRMRNDIDKIVVK